MSRLSPTENAFNTVLSVITKDSNTPIAIDKTDDLLKALRNLLKRATNETDKAEIQGYIDEMIAEIQDTNKLS